MIGARGVLYCRVFGIAEFFFSARVVKQLNLAPANVINKFLLTNFAQTFHALEPVYKPECLYIHI
jgi:hypothetical protein